MRSGYIVSFAPKLAKLNCTRGIYPQIINDKRYHFRQVVYIRENDFGATEKIFYTIGHTPKTCTVVFGSIELLLDKMCVDVIHVH